MPMKRNDRIARIAYVVTHQTHRREAIEIWWGGDEHGIGPEAEPITCQRRPRELHAGIVLASWCDIAVTDYRLTRDTQSRGEVGEQVNQRLDLRLGERRIAVVVDLDADGR